MSPVAVWLWPVQSLCSQPLVVVVVVSLSVRNVQRLSKCIILTKDDSEGGAAFTLPLSHTPKGSFIIP